MCRKIGIGDMFLGILHRIRVFLAGLFYGIVKTGQCRKRRELCRTLFKRHAGMLR